MIDDNSIVEVKMTYGFGYGRFVLESVGLYYTINIKISVVITFMGRVTDRIIYKLREWMRTR